MADVLRIAELRLLRLVELEVDVKEVALAVLEVEGAALGGCRSLGSGSLRVLKEVVAEDEAHARCVLCNLRFG